MNDEPVRAIYLRTTDGKEFQLATEQAWLSSLVYENKDAERAYSALEASAGQYPEYELISKERFLKAFGQEPKQSQTPLAQDELKRPELSMEEKLKNNYWRVANGYAPSPDNTQTAPKPELKPSETISGDETWRKAERSEWGDFPPLIRNSSLEELKKH